MDPITEDIRGACVDEIFTFVQDELSQVDRSEVGYWCENNAIELSEIYMKYIGVSYAKVYASHLMYFIHTTFSVSPSVQLVVGMLRTYVECQLCDLPYAID